MEFINGGLAGMAALAAVPVILHLFHRPRPKEQPFPSVMFLRRCARRSRNFARVRNVVLMILRAAAVAGIALAVARPRLAGAAPAGEEAFAAAVVLDDSFRMGYREGGPSRFEEARRRALDVLATFPAATECALALSSGEATPLLPDPAALRAELLRANPTDLASPILPALLEAARSLEPARETRKEVHVFTDLARAAWTGLPAGAIKALAGATVFVHDVGRDAPVNAAVTRVQVSPRSPRSGRPVEIAATVASWGRGGPVTVALRIGDAVAAEKSVTVADGGTALVRFLHTPEAVAALHGAVALATPDPLAADDARHFAVAVNDPLRVLVVEPEPDPDRGTAPFLSTALSPPSLRQKSPAAVTRAGPADLARLDLKAFDVIFLADARPVSPADLHRMSAFVQGGGGLAVFGSPEAPPEMDRATGLGLFPAVQGGDGAAAHLAPAGTDHPVFQTFRAGRNGDLGAATFALRLKLRPDARWRTAIAFDDGSPAALQAESGRGRILAFAFAPMAASSDLPKFPCFVPLVHEIARHLSRSSFAERDFPAGVPVVYPLARAPSDVEYGFLNLVSGSHEARRADPALAALPLARALPPGRYLVDMADGKRPFSVNLDPAGSDPTRCSRGEVTKLLPGANVSFAFARAPAQEIKEARTGREFTLLVLLAVVLVSLVEIAVASLR